MCRKICGFTLMEFLVTIAVVALLAAVVVPSIKSLIQGERATGFSNTLLAGIWLARSEAVKRNVRVVMCKSTDGATCTTNGIWSAGWLVFVDENNNANHESAETVLLVEGAWPPGWTGRGNSPVAHYVSYTPQGLSQFTSGAFQAGTFTICNAEYSKGKKVVINSMGRPRIETFTVETC
jgi:type IV fimbrial biogenesis protein FimT